jgi:hypothetical protein
MQSPYLPIYRFIGTWKLLSQDTHFKDGRSVASRGENPLGILMYDAHGQMSVQLSRSDAHLSAYTDLTALSTAMDGYLAYFGTYTVDETARTVTHHIAGASYPGYRGTEQVRTYAFSEDFSRLTLRAAAPSGDAVRVLVWERV